MEDSVKLFIATVTHRHGHNIYIGTSEADRDNKLANYVLEQGLEEWAGSHTPKDQGELDTTSDRDLIERYFDGHPTEYTDYFEDELPLAVETTVPILLQALKIAEEQYENFAGVGKDDGTLGVIRSAITSAENLKTPAPE